RLDRRHRLPRRDAHRGHPLHDRQSTHPARGGGMSTALPVAVEVPTQAKLARRERLGQLVRSKTFLVGVIIVGFWVFWGIAGTALTPHDPLDQTADVL